MKLIICEKPSVAKEFTNALSNNYNINFKNENRAYISNDITISSAQGHLIELAQPAHYNEAFKKWNINDLPIIPENEFKLIVSKKNISIFNNLKKLIENADEIYNAADSGREGELIFRYIINLCNIKPQTIIKRIWASDIEHKTLINAYENSKDQKEYQSLYLAAKARNEADWLIGINATRMLTLASKTNKTLSLGRVQTAILRLIVDRFEAIQNFVSKDTFKPEIEIDDIILSLNETFYSKEEAQTILDKLANNVLLEKQTNDKSIRQPKLFSLPDLQIQASKELNLSATQTLAIAQDLYEKKLISYPRTDSNYLNESQKSTINDTLLNFIKSSKIKEDYKINSNDFIQDSEYNSHFIFNDKKTSDHYAIIPLEQNYINTYDAIKNNENSLNLYNLILVRFLQCFMIKPIIEETIYFVKLNEQLYFFNKGKIIKKEGFLKIKNSITDIILPNIEPGKKNIKNKLLKQGKTNPLPLFTEATLLSAMKNPLNHQKIKSNSDFIKSLGTPATNDKYLPLLIERNYVSLIKKNIIPTKLGISIIKLLKGTKITSIELTADIESEINKIHKKNSDYTSFMSATKNYVKILLKEIEAKASKIEVETKQYNICPKCKTGKLYLSKTKKNYYCSNFKNNEINNSPCDFILFKNIAGNSLTEIQIKKLVTNKKTDLLKFKSSKTDKKFKAYIILDKDFKTQFQFKN